MRTSFLTVFCVAALANCCQAVITESAKPQNTIPPKQALTQPKISAPYNKYKLFIKSENPVPEFTE